MSATLRQIEREVATEVLSRLGDAVLDILVLNPDMTADERKVAKAFSLAVIDHVREQYSDG